MWRSSDGKKPKIVFREYVLPPIPMMNTVVAKLKILKMKEYPVIYFVMYPSTQVKLKFLSKKLGLIKTLP